MEVEGLTLDEIEKKIRKAHGKCYKCKREIKYGTIRSYDHEGGIKVKGFRKKQWVYFLCPYCNSMSALWKVIRFLE